MAAASRRKFLVQASLGLATGAAAAAGGLAAIPRLVGYRPAPRSTAVSDLKTTPGEHMVVHVRDFTTGEVAILLGTREIVHRDPEMVAQLLRAARRAEPGSRPGGR